jgi:hypothetical protein
LPTLLSRDADCLMKATPHKHDMKPSVVYSRSSTKGRKWKTRRFRANMATPIIDGAVTVEYFDRITNFLP